MTKHRYPVTPGIRFLRSHNIAFKPLTYDYEDHGGAGQAAQKLGLDPFTVVKTLVMETDVGVPLLVLMHGSREVSTKQLARLLSVKKVAPCEPEIARKLTGYKVGGISPFGTVKAMTVYAQSTLFELEKIRINGGKRGFLVEMDPMALKASLNAIEVDAAV